MLKKFVLMLIVLFTLQMSWAVASAYCMHETDKTAQHFGHHPHQHDAETDKAELGGQASDKSSSQKAAAHPDCASCASSQLGDHSINFRANPNSANSYPFSLATLPVPTSLPDRPERPKWMALA